jgi:UDPglucose 6-dehydrogenase
MKISFIGLGKLGLPTAYAMAYKGHEVLGYDINMDRYTTKLDTIEAGKNGEGTYQELFNENPNTEKNLKFTHDMATCVLYGDIIFVAIQTPHKREFEGIMPLTENREDFEYKHLVKCIRDISYILEKNNLTKTVSMMLRIKLLNFIKLLLIHQFIKLH